MSGSNGHEAKYLTIDELLAKSETDVELPQTSSRHGSPQKIRVRVIGASEYLSLLLPPPPGSESWPAEERTARELAWFETLPPEQQSERRAQARGIFYHVTAIASLNPKLTFEQAFRLGEDAVTVAMKVLEFSGLAKPLPVPTENLPSTADAAAPVAGPAPVVEESAAAA